VTLRSLPALLRAESALFSVVGRRDAQVVAAEAAWPLVVASLATLGQRRPLLVVTATGQEAERVAHDLAAFLPPGTVDHFPAWETLPFERVSPSLETMGRRLSVLARLEANEAGVVVAPVRALLARLASGSRPVPRRRIARGDRVDPTELVATLVAWGYRREVQVEHRGEVAVRGAIVDVFPPAAAQPIRLDLFGDDVERLSAFDVGTQRSVEDVEAVELVPCRELRPGPAERAAAAQLVTTAPWGQAAWRRVADGELFDGMESFTPWLGDEEVLADRIGPDGLVVLLEPRRLRDRAVDVGEEEASLAGVLAGTWGLGADERVPRLHVPFERMLARTTAAVLSLVAVPDRPDTPTVASRAVELGPSGAGRVGQVISGLAADGLRVVVAAEGSGSVERIVRVLRDEGVAARPADGLPAPGEVVVAAEPLERGCVLPTSGLAVVAEADFTGRRRAHRRPRPRARPVDGFFDNLRPGDYVVHRVHGVGRYQGMARRALGGAERDYLVLEYRGSDRLYVPSDQIDVLTPYVSGETPTLHRLGGADFARARAKVRQAVDEIAEELVELYRARQQAPGLACGPDTPWQAEMEAAFPYSETRDQLRAIEEVKADMESPRPMDRLVCGDVGFGKTEVAIRAVFKAVQEGRQAAVLVPTTLLAQQHGQTFADRFAGYPVRVEVLSRFLTPLQAKTVLAGLADGSVDVVIGTHRLLSGDVQFRRLGLLVVDEEQRFGVSHKEAIKRLSVGIDVLTLSATPIPRTLEMALTGIRDLSLLETPPEERQPILTFVGEYDERAVTEAIRRELLREGQVFFVHNRVQDIDQVAARLSALVPEARIAIAHGQMDEGALEQVVLDFWEGRYDVLVCTTIIESGIDMPTVNTLVVDRADALGLGQLHQLRGRVGRAGMRAYAYLFHPADRTLSEEAYERLRTIGEHTELGSGFKIALRDLEIRGAGNLLGRDQSGHIATVGYDLYVQMVQEALDRATGRVRPEPIEVSLDLPLTAHLPESYVPSEDARLEAYRRLAGVTSEDEVDDLEAEWRDRFGPPPEPAEALLRVARLRALCRRLGVRELTVSPPAPGRPPRARLRPVTVSAAMEIRLARRHPGHLYKSADLELQLPLPREGDVVDALMAMLPAIFGPQAASLSAGPGPTGEGPTGEGPAGEGPTGEGPARAERARPAREGSEARPPVRTQGRLAARRPTRPALR